MRFGRARDEADARIQSSDLFLLRIAGVSADCFVEAVSLVAPTLRTLILHVGPLRFYIPDDLCSPQSILRRSPRTNLDSAGNRIIPKCSSAQVVYLNDPGVFGDLFGNLSQLRSLNLAFYGPYTQHDSSPLKSFCSNPSHTLPSLERLTVYHPDYESMQDRQILQASCDLRGIELEFEDHAESGGDMTSDLWELFTSRLPASPFVSD